MTEIEFLRQLMDERDVRYQQRFDAQNKAIDSALVSADRAVTKAEVATEKRFESMNEIRGAMDDAAKNYISRVEVEAWREQSRENVTKLDSRITTIEGLSTGREKGKLDYNALIMMAIGVTALIVAFFHGAKT